MSRDVLRRYPQQGSWILVGFPLTFPALVGSYYGGGLRGVLFIVCLFTFVWIPWIVGQQWHYIYINLTGSYMYSISLPKGHRQIMLDKRVAKVICVQYCVSPWGANATNTELEIRFVDPEVEPIRVKFWFALGLLEGGFFRKWRHHPELPPLEVPSTPIPMPRWLKRKSK